MSDDVVFVEKDGRQRPGEVWICEASDCDNEFIRRADYTRAQRYCSRKCSSDARQNRIELVCDKCGHKFKRKKAHTKQSRSGLMFCSRKCKDEAQQLASGMSDLWPSHYGHSSCGGDLASRADVKPLVEQGCVDCGKKQRLFLNVHHIDGDRSNNDLSNFEVVCRNHHSIRHLHLVDGEWVFGTRYLTPREMIPVLLAQEM